MALDEAIDRQVQELERLERTVRTQFQVLCLVSLVVLYFIL